MSTILSLPTPWPRSKSSSLSPWTRTDYDLPRTVRESAIRAVMQIRSWRHRAASNRAVVQEKDGQFSVVCSIADMGSDVFRMELAMPDKLTAEMIKNNFIAHGSDIFPKLLNALTQPGSEDDRPPAGLM